MASERRMVDRPIYDDPFINAAYSELRSQPGRPNDIIERPALQSLMPALQGRTVVDLGCGTGGMSRWALGQGAVSVQSFDASETMVSEAAKLGNDPRLIYQQSRIEDIEFPVSSVDVVMSGLALHYVRDLATLIHRVARWLKPGGSLLFSVEHPIMTCASRRWTETADGTRLH
jgi:2-polyprenyl-3-methyl-5-hydroxy-6-metoxy-1,4-benzoquinol methylase